ncbi:hypothetical protein [Clostridium botulinum]|uniref:hypothetical protein n=1 Tax=Clostridium botulinum TaxID=1491 RepID=UPI000A171AE7|nr:hypothetical protein [Clostridium botulinum]AUN11583.1 hypothetical protein RSJ6_14175 [Clostridium botulinum]OSA71600.1 hypothetical protein B2H87_05980 [Clostridium botulinum]
MFNKNKEIEKVCKELQEVIEKSNKEFQFLLKTYINNIEDNRKNICEKCDEVISECRKYRGKL